MGELVTWPALLVGGAGTAPAPASGYALLVRRFVLARVLAAGQVALLLAGWGAPQWPYIVYPDLTIAGSAAPAPTVQVLSWTAPVGLGLLLPLSLVLVQRL